MREIKLFDLDAELEFSSDKAFRKSLVRSTTLQSSLRHSDLYVAISLMDFDNPQQLESLLRRHSFEIQKRFGTVWLVQRSTQDGALDSEDFEFYLGPNWETGVACFYTNYRKTEEIRRFLMPMLRSSRLDRFVLYPTLLQKLLDQIFQDYPLGRMTQFTARTTPGSKTRFVKRPEEKRTVSYWGDDGRYTYPEMHELYGTAIVRAVVELPESSTKFKLSQEGVVAFCNGEPTVFFDLLEKFLIPEAARQRKIVTSSTTRYVSLGAGKSKYQAPIVCPMKIRLQSSLEYTRVAETFVATLERLEFPVMSSFLREGSLYLDAVLVDSKWDSHFRVKANEDWLKLLPGKHTRLSTFLRFYQVVLNEIDPYATLEVVT